MLQPSSFISSLLVTMLAAFCGSLMLIDVVFFYLGCRGVLQFKVWNSRDKTICSRYGN
jgi:hypothetical protein